MVRWILGLLTVALVAAGCSGTDSGQAEAGQPSDGATATTASATAPVTCPSEGEPLDTAKLYIEHNATDEDTGVHGLFGGSAWSELCIWDPTGRLIMMVDPQGQLNDLKVADLFFESREPPADEYSLDDLQADFPEGNYTVGGTDFEGIPRVGEALFTHNVPAEPSIITPELADDEDRADEVLVNPIGLVIRWDPVTELVSGNSLTITGYEVIITKVEHEDPHGGSRPVYDVHVGPDGSSLPVPDGFLESDTVYELEVLALEASGNQTISVGFFATD